MPIGYPFSVLWCFVEFLYGALGRISAGRVGLRVGDTVPELSSGLDAKGAKDIGHKEGDISVDAIVSVCTDDLARSFVDGTEKFSSED